MTGFPRPPRLEPGRPLDACERAALRWLNALESAEQLLAELVPDPTRPPFSRPPFGERPAPEPPRPLPWPPVERPPFKPPPGALRTAHAILRFRDAQPRQRLTSLAQLQGVTGVTKTWLAHLRHTGCTKIPAPRPAPTPGVAVLLGLRIETRFDPGRLRVRVIPDEPWISRHDARAGAGELDALERTVAALAETTDPDAARLAFSELAGQAGGARAVWLMRHFVTTGPDGRPVVTRPPEADLRTEPAFPRIVGFPDTLQVWLVRGGIPTPALTLNVDQDRLTLAMPDRDAGQRRWWEDWDQARLAGLAGEIKLDDDSTDIDALIVCGLSDDAPGGLFADHRDAGSLGVMAPGTPTNTVDGAPAASLGQGADEWWQVLHGSAGDSVRRLSAALTGDADALGALPGTDEPQRDQSAALIAGLWPALWGFAGADVWALAGTAQAGDWAPNALLPEGPYATLRVGRQPYGLLPLTLLDRWVPAPGDPKLEAGLAGPLARLADHWRAGAEQRGTVTGASTAGLLDLLGHVPTSPGYRHRAAFPLELWWLALLLMGVPATWEDLDAAWHADYHLARDLGLSPARRYGARSASRRMRLPLVRPAALAEEIAIADVLQELVDYLYRTPQAFAFPSRLDLRYPLDSLLLRLALRSLQVALGELGREGLGEAPPQPEPLARPNADGLARRIQAAQQFLNSGSPADIALRRTIEGLTRLGDMSEERLERLLRATLDCAIHRIDPWFTGPPTRRLEDLLAGGRAAFRLGAYGWVDGPKPGTPGPNAAGLIHAPSATQARTAAVLRDRAINDPEPRWKLEHTSRSVREAERVAEQVRVGAHLNEAVGREVERIAADRDLVTELRERFPVRTEHAGRRTCDGVAVLAADQTTLGLDSDALDALERLRAGLDTYGDLLVAEGVHHVTQRRPESAAAAMDAAAGLSRPPHLEVLRTAREGRAVATSVILLLTAVDAPAVPADPDVRALVSPAELVDASAAAFVVEQVGAAASWSWDVVGGGTVTLEDLGLSPAGALSLSIEDLERVVLETAAVASGSSEVTLSASSGSEKYEAAARAVALLGRSPAGPDAFAQEPEETAGGTVAAAVDADLGARFAAVRGTAAALAAEFAAELALTSSGAIGTADPNRLGELLVAARGWGIAPDAAGLLAQPPVTPGAPPGDPLVLAASRARELLDARLRTAPASASGLSRAAVVDALTALASPTGQLALLSRLPIAEFPELSAAPGFESAWLPVIAAVREPLARIELHNLAVGSSHGAGPALGLWSSKPSDPWQQDATDSGRMVVAATSATLDLDTLAATANVAAAVVDRFTETIPAPEQSTSAVFGFDAPAARAPQAILLAVPPDVSVPWDADALRDVILQARMLSRVRMARPSDLGAAARALLPSVLVPASGRLATSFEPPVV